MIDAHTHLNFPELFKEIDDVVKRAEGAGVRLMLDVGVDIPSSKLSVELSSRYSSVYSAVGLHPLSVKDNVDKKELESFLLKAGKKKKVVAIGETGLDLFKGKENRELQLEYFHLHADVARRLGKPLMIHSREADDEFMYLLEEYDFPHGGILHCFTGSEELALKAVSKGFFISFSGIVTFPKAENVREVLKCVPVERVLTETDAPFLAPRSHRGKRNEPGFVVEVAEMVAEVKGISIDDVKRNMLHNFHQAFKLKEDNPPVIVYPIRNSLYINLTNACNNRCDFCTRESAPFVQGHNLGIKGNPTSDEVCRELEKYPLEKVDEVVFCGFGEPTLRFNTLVEVARRLKEKGVRTRLNTNGQGSLVNKQNIVPVLEQVIDAVSVSLNASTKEQYNAVCKPEDEAHAYDAILDFIKKAHASSMKTTVSIVTYPGMKDESECEKMAKEIGVPLRIRHYNDVG